MNIEEFKKRFNDRNFVTLQHYTGWDKVITKTLDYFGEDAQLVTTIEELCELSQAIAKYLRGFREEDNYYNVLEEVADVYICLEHIKKIILDKYFEEAKSDMINRAVQIKINRMTDRLKKLEE